MRLYRRDAEALGNPLRSSQRCEVGSDGQATRLEQIRLLRDRRVHNPRTLSVARPFYRCRRTRCVLGGTVPES